MVATQPFGYPLRSHGESVRSHRNFPTHVTSTVRTTRYAPRMPAAGCRMAWEGCPLCQALG